MSKTTEKTTHTPGPWRVRESDGVWVEGPNPGDSVLCDIVGRVFDVDAGSTVIQPEDLANARLIAAAPDLLLDLKGLLYLLPEIDQIVSMRNPKYELLTRCINACRADIAKAEGRT